jgi:glycosyltransferase involved in cell wall biosynthesis/CelD/BcsL family acetyltransferase involved in cellulose biosynthesis
MVQSAACASTSRYNLRNQPLRFFTPSMSTPLPASPSATPPSETVASPPARLPSVTVVIPAYRAAATIAAAVASVLAQTAPAQEIIVVDDGGDDALAEALAPFSAQVTLLRKPNGGAASARNLGISTARGELVAFLDADDTWEPHKLTRQLEVLQAHPEVGMVGAHLYLQQPGQARSLDPDIDPTLFDRVLKADEGQTFHIAAMFWTGTVMVRRELLREDRFDEALSTAEDRDLWFRLLCKAPSYLLGEALATCVLMPGSLSRTQVDRDMTNLLLIIDRHQEAMGQAEYERAKARAHLRWMAQLRSQGRGSETLALAWAAWRHAPSMRGVARLGRAALSALGPVTRTTAETKELHIEEVRSLEALRSLAPEWRALYAACPQATVSTSWEWLFTWWEVFGAGRELKVLLARDAGKLVGIAPLLQRRVAGLGGVGHVRRLELLASGEPEADEIHTEYLEFLIEPGREAEVSKALWDGISRWKQWDELRMLSVPGSARMRMHFRDAAACPRTRVRDRPRPQAVVIPLAATPAAFMAAQGRKMREDLRRHKRMLEQSGPLRVERAATVEDLRRLFPTFIALHQALWTSRGEPGCFASAAFTLFHEKVSERLFATGQTHLHILYVGDKPLAARYGFNRGSRMFEYQSGNDPTFDPRISVGLVSMLLCMEDAIERGMTEYDMGEGTRPYKLRWTHELRTTHTLEISRRNARMAWADTVALTTQVARRWRRRNAVAAMPNPPPPAA